MAAARCRS